VERRDRIDVDEVRRFRQTERHGGHQTLPTGQDASVLGCMLAEQSDRLAYVGRGVVDEARWLHRWFSVRAKFMCMLNLDSTKSTRSKTALLLKDGGLVVRLGVNVRGHGAQQGGLWHYAKRGTSAHNTGDDVVEEILGANQESLPRQGVRTILR